MPMMTTCPPRCRRNADQAHLATNRRVNLARATKISRDRNAKTGRHNDVRNDRLKNPQNASRRRKATSNRVAVSAMLIAAAMQTGPSNSVRIKLARNNRAPIGLAVNDQINYAMNNAANVRAAIGPGKSRDPKVGLKADPNLDRNHAPNNHVPIAMLLSSATEIVTADRNRLSPSKAAANPPHQASQPNPPSVFPRRPRIRRSLRSPVWA